MKISKVVILKPCPFCGKEAELKSAIIMRGAYHIMCKNCGLDAQWFGAEFSETEMMERWNRRAENE